MPSPLSLTTSRSLINALNLETLFKQTQKQKTYFYKLFLTILNLGKFGKKMKIFLNFLLEIIENLNTNLADC